MQRGQSSNGTGGGASPFTTMVYGSLPPICPAGQGPENKNVAPSSLSWKFPLESCEHSPLGSMNANGLFRP